MGLLFRGALTACSSALRHPWLPHADSSAAPNEGTGREVHRTPQAAAPSWAAIRCHRECPPRGSPFPEERGHLPGQTLRPYPEP